MNNLILLLTLSLLWSPPSNNVKIFEWRGKDRTGIYNESNLLKVWPVEGPTEIWTLESFGEGFVSPVFTDDNFFITGEIDSLSIIFCFNLEGEKLWQTTLGREWIKSYPGSRCAPTIVDDLVYVGSGLGNLYCLDRASGKIIWYKDLIKDFNGVLPLHGYSEAPVVDGERVFWTPGGEKNNVVAINRFTGELIWSNKGFGERSAYNPGKLIELPERNIFVTFSAYHLMGLDTRTGELLWSHEQDNYPLNERIFGIGDTHSNAVLYDDGSIYYAAGDGNGGVRLDLSKDGSKITEVWRNKSFDSFMGGILKIGDYLYGCGTVRPGLKAIEASTGNITDSLRMGSGAVIAADDMLYYYSHRGNLSLFSYAQGKVQRVSHFRIERGTQQHFSHPVIHKGILYQRHGNVLMAFDIRRK